MKIQEVKEIIENQIKLVQKESEHSDSRTIADLSLALVALIELHENL